MYGGRGVFWCPSGREFMCVAADGEVSLRRLKNGGQSLSNSVDEVLAVTSVPASPFIITTAAVHPHSDHLLAVGCTSGKVELVSPVQSSTSDPPTFSRLAGVAFTPRHQRQCQCVDWSPSQPSWLAAGFDKHRNGNAILVWDICSRPASVSPVDDRSSLSRNMFRGPRQTSSGGPLNESGSSVPIIGAKPMFETAVGESCASLSWFPDGVTMAVGLATKSLQIYDVRDASSSKPQRTIATKAVYGVSVSPLNNRQLCSYSDNGVVQLWDLRSGGGGDKLKAWSTQEAPINQLQWDPTRNGVIYCSCKEKNVIKQYQVLSLSTTTDDDGKELGSMDRHFFMNFPGDNKRTADQPAVCIAAFCCHPTERNRLISISTEGTICHRQLSEDGCLQWHPSGRLVVSFNSVVAELTDFDAAAATVADKSANNGQSQLQIDIAETMRELALCNYGCEEKRKTKAEEDRAKEGKDKERAVLQVSAAAERAAQHARQRTDGNEYAAVEWVWRWMQRIFELPDELLKMWPFDHRFPGVIAISNSRLSDTGTSMEWRQIEGMDVSAKVFISRERELIMRVCGWTDSTEASSSSFRLAAIAMFKLQYKQAVEMLSRIADDGEGGAESQLVAIALAGYQTASTRQEQKALWQQLCRSLLPSLVAQPFLKAMFVFLSCRLEMDDMYERLMDMEDLPLYDKIAFASLHLADRPFSDQLQKLLKGSVASGNLYGLLLTGVHHSQRNDECEKLLQNYVDRTSDVQSAALFLIHGGYSTSGGLRSQSRTPSSTSINTAGALPRLLEEVHVPYSTARNIVDGYLNLLNGWCLWQFRARVEALMLGTKFGAPWSSVAANSSSRLPSQVALRCTFCSKSTVVGTGGGGPTPGSRSTMRLSSVGGGCAPLATRPLPGGAFSKPGACHNCRKPLPRCAICRRHMGLALPALSAADKQKGHWWFSWCQTCRHGGHVLHLRQWFSVSTECPVTGCGCRCAQLDSLFEVDRTTSTSASSVADASS